MQKYIINRYIRSSLQKFLYPGLGASFRAISPQVSIESVRRLQLYFGLRSEELLQPPRSRIGRSIRCQPGRAC